MQMLFTQSGLPSRDQRERSLHLLFTRGSQSGSGDCRCLSNPHPDGASLQHLFHQPANGRHVLMDQPVKRLILLASSESIAAFSEFVRKGAVSAGVAPEEFEKLDLVLEEILINVARYAYTPRLGKVEVTYCQERPGKLRVEIADFGRVFNPLETDPPDLSRGLADRPIGGLGVFLVKSLVDSISYRREDNRNILSFTFPPDQGAIQPMVL